MAVGSDTCSQCRPGQTFKANIQPDVKTKVWQLLTLFLACTWNTAKNMAFKQLNRMHAILVWHLLEDLTKHKKEQTNLEKVTKREKVWHVTNFFFFKNKRGGGSTNPRIFVLKKEQWASFQTGHLLFEYAKSKILQLWYLSWVTLFSQIQGVGERSPRYYYLEHS